MKKTYFMASIGASTLMLALSTAAFAACPPAPEVFVERNGVNWCNPGSIQTVGGAGAVSGSFTPPADDAGDDEDDPDTDDGNGGGGTDEPPVDQPGDTGGEEPPVDEPGEEEPGDTGGEEPGDTGGEEPGDTGGEEPGDNGGGGEEPGDTGGEEPGDNGGGTGEEPGDTGGEEPGDNGGGTGEEPGDNGGGTGEEPGDNGGGGEEPGDTGGEQPTDPTIQPPTVNEDGSITVGVNYFPQYAGTTGSGEVELNGLEGIPNGTYTYSITNGVATLTVKPPVVVEEPGEEPGNGGPGSGGPTPTGPQGPTIDENGVITGSIDYFPQFANVEDGNYGNQPFFGFPGIPDGYYGTVVEDRIATLTPVL